MLICDRPCEIPEDGIDGVNLKCKTPSANFSYNLPSDPNSFGFNYYSCIIILKVKDKKNFEPASFYQND